jgi:crossover junction endodeoxyribonuclease RuvC
MRVLGIDPSLNSTGYGVIDYTHSVYSVKGFGVIKPPSRFPLHKKINEIRIRIEKLIHEFGPGEIAVENPFYAQNIKTALTLGQVRGAVLVAVASSDLPLFEYSALEIKKAVTGYGQADKNQVRTRTMIKTLLCMEDTDLGYDASDALAAAFCHSNFRLWQDKIGEKQ